MLVSVKDDLLDKTLEVISRLKETTGRPGTPAD